MDTLPRPREDRSDRLTPARAALVLTALAAFAPAIPGWTLAWRYGRIPQRVVVTLASLHDTGTGAPPLLAAESVATSPDGTLFVADRTHRHLVTFPPSGRPRWLAPAGRFEARVGPDGRLHLLDLDTGTLVRFSAAGQLERRLAVAEPGSAPVFCLAQDGRVVVAAAGAIRRLTSDLDGPDPSWGPPAHAVPAPDVVALASTADRVYAVSRGGTLAVYSAEGTLVCRQRLVGNAGPVAASPDGQLVAGDPQTGRLFLLDREGRTTARLVSEDGRSPVSSPTDLAFLRDGRLAVATGKSVDVLALSERP